MLGMRPERRLGPLIGNGNRKSYGIHHFPQKLEYDLLENPGEFHISPQYFATLKFPARFGMDKWKNLEMV